MIFFVSGTDAPLNTLIPFTSIKKKPLWSEIAARLLHQWNKACKRRANREEWKTEILGEENLAWFSTGILEARWNGI